MSHYRPIVRPKLDEGMTWCPVCNGNGTIDEDAGGGNYRTYKCAACKGTGEVKDLEESP